MANGNIRLTPEQLQALIDGNPPGGGKAKKPSKGQRAAGIASEVAGLGSLVGSGAVGLASKPGQKKLKSAAGRQADRTAQGISSGLISTAKSATGPTAGLGLNAAIRGAGEVAGEAAGGAANTELESLRQQRANRFAQLRRIGQFGGEIGAFGAQFGAGLEAFGGGGAEQGPAPGGQLDTPGTPTAAPPGASPLGLENTPVGREAAQGLPGAEAERAGFQQTGQAADALSTAGAPQATIRDLALQGAVGAQQAPALPQRDLQQALSTGQVSPESASPLQMLLANSGATDMEVADISAAALSGQLTSDNVQTLRRVLGMPDVGPLPGTAPFRIPR